ncbi:MAG: hypothetical protein P8Z78_13425 [Gammaproteobacteria bacterium]
MRIISNSLFLVSHAVSSPVQPLLFKSFVVDDPDCTSAGQFTSSAFHQSVSCIGPNDVVVTRARVSEGNGDRTVYVGVPNATADWICITDYKGNVKQVYFGGSEGAM